MKSLKLTMMLLIAVAVSTASMAQGGDQKKAKDAATKVSKFDAGRSLSSADLGFLNVIANGPDNKSRGMVKEVTIDKAQFTAGQKLTKDQAAMINKAVAEYTKAHKDTPEGNTRGAVCYYYYCDGYGNCYYVYYYC